MWCIGSYISAGIEKEKKKKKSNGRSVHLPAFSPSSIYIYIETRRKEKIAAKEDLVPSSAFFIVKDGNALVICVVQ